MIVTLDNHLAGVVERVERTLAREIPGLTLELHAAADFAADADRLAACRGAIADADIVVATMLFLEDHIRLVEDTLAARRDNCAAMVCAMCAGEVIRLTRMGGLAMDKADSGPLALLKRLRGSKSKAASSGAGQMAMLRRLPKLLRFIPGKAQDLRAYFLTLQYWLAGSDENIANLVRLLVGRYAAPKGTAPRAEAPIDYPDTGLYHPKLKGRIGEDPAALPRTRTAKGTVGLLILRSYALAGDTGHYDGVIAALEARGLNVVPAFASGLDSRPAIERFFMSDGRASVDAVISLTGFSLVGGPAYNDAEAAQAILGRLDVPYLAAHPVEFQSLQRWAASSAGLMPVEQTIMVAIPELDGAIQPMIYGGRGDPSGEACCGCDRHCTFEAAGRTPQMQSCTERAGVLAARVEKVVALRRAERAKRRLAIVLFNFPPNAGAAGTAAFLSVFESLHRTLIRLKAEGYSVEVPETVDALRDAVLNGNAARHGTDANVHARIPADDHVRRERRLAAIEKQWGPAPGRALSDGGSLFVLGERFGEVFVGLQPGFGYEGDPMRLLFEQGFAPTHAFSAFYRWLREDFGAHAVLHFGTHGALEFMPGKQTGLGEACWPEALIGDLPNFYLYAANNPSEGTIAKRRAGATLISYVTPPVAEAGLYAGLSDLKASVERWRAAAPDAAERDGLAELIVEQAEALQISGHGDNAAARIAAIAEKLRELEHALIPEGMHIVGEPMSRAARISTLKALARSHDLEPADAALEALADGAPGAKALAKSGLKASAETRALFETLAAANAALARDHELDAIVHALDGGYVRPAPGGDLIRNPASLPAGRNIHGFDPFRIPSAFAVRDGAAQAERLLARHAADGGGLPETVALVLWGTDNLKSEGAQIALALALMGARPRLDSYGRLSGAALIPLEELGRPRIDVVTTLSGIFRDLLPLQTKMLAEAAFLAAAADEPAEMNHVRAHALAHMKSQGCDLETAALRVFSNAEGAYGANVNHLVDAGCWNAEDELADAYEARKSFAYGRDGRPQPQAKVLAAVLAGVDLAYQNLESVELGVTTIDHYFDTLGGIARAVARAKGKEAPVYIGDQTAGAGTVRTLKEQVALETRSRTLNPRWYEPMLKHGYEGVRQIESQVTNTLGWSATTGEVEPWVYQKITETYVLDAAMRARLAEANPKASARMANRLIEAHERRYWTPDEATLRALREAGEELEDRLEGIAVAAA